MKNILLVLIISLLTSTAFGQEKHSSNNYQNNYVDSAIFYFNKSKTAYGIDSLAFKKGLKMIDSMPVNTFFVKRIENIAEDYKSTSKIGCLKIYSVLFWRLVDVQEYNKAITIGRVIINNSEDDPNPDIRVLFLNTLSNLRIPYRISDKLDEGFDFYTKKLEQYIQKNDTIPISKCYFVLGGFYSSKGLNDLSIYYYKKSIPYLNVDDTIGGNNSERYMWTNNMAVVGHISIALGDYQSAITYSRAALNSDVSCDCDGLTRSFAYKNIAYAKIMLNEPDSVIYFLNKGIEKARVIRGEAYTSICYLVKGIYYLKMNQLDSSEFYLQECNRMITKFDINANSTAGIINPYYYLAQVRIKQNRFKEAEEIFLEEIPRLGNLRRELIEDYKLLVEVYLNLGDVKNAKEAFVQYHVLQEELQADERSNRKLSFETEQKIAEAENTIINLTTEKKLAALSKNYWTGIAVILLISFLIIFNRFRITRRQKVIIGVAKEKAEQSEKFKQQFLANMSHEIRTPMNAVMGMTNLLIEKNPRTDQFNYLDGIKRSSDNLLHIINDILDLSKIEVGKMELEHIDFSMLDVIEQVKQTLKYKADEKGLELFMDIDPKIPDVFIGDPTRLTQVLINLTGNAIKFTEKGSVTIEIKKADEFDSFRFSILDTGIGIPKDKLQTVFESFAQAKTSDTRKFGGTGLGLTISKQLVELMGGSISIESEEGAGTTFSFEINLPEGSDERMQQKRSSEQIDGNILNGLKILLADDNEHNRIVARDTLQLKSHVTITEALNGQDVIDIFSENDFDVILMDVQMPVMDGFEATKHIREKFPSPKNQIPVIALTASVVRSDLDKCRKAGMTDFVPKPFKTHQLINAIAKATNRQLKLVDENNIAVKNTPDSGITVTDLRYLEEFCEGDKLRMKKYINIFLESSPMLIEKLNAALKENDFELIADQIHSFKTKWIMMGMMETKDLAHEIEQQLRNGSVDMTITKENVVKLLDHIRAAMEELTEI